MDSVHSQGRYAPGAVSEANPSSVRRSSPPAPRALRAPRGRLLGWFFALLCVALGTAVRVHAALHDSNFDATSPVGMLKSDPGLLYYFTESIVRAGGMPPPDFRAPPLDFRAPEADLRARAPPEARPAGSAVNSSSLSPSDSAPPAASPMSDMADPPASSSSGIPIPFSKSSCIIAFQSEKVRSGA